MMSLFEDETPLTRGNSYYYNTQHNHPHYQQYQCEEPLSFLERDYLTHFLEQQRQKEEEEYRRRCQYQYEQAALQLQQQAYLEEQLERKRRKQQQQRRLEEERRHRQYLKELREIEHRRELEEERERQQEQEQQERRQYLAHLAQKQQEQRLYQQDILRNQRATALEALRRREQNSRPMNEMEQHQNQYQIIQGLDGNFYMVMLDPKLKDHTEKGCSGGKRVMHSTNNHGRKKDSTLKSSSSNEEGESVVRPTATINSVTFKDCFNNKNINDKATEVLEATSKEGTKKTRFVIPNKKRVVKSSVLIGGVEDASDSEYENDEYNDYWHNRRPQPGQWIEPVNYHNTSK